MKEAQRKRTMGGSGVGGEQGSMKARHYAIALEAGIIQRVLTA